MQEASRTERAGRVEGTRSRRAFVLVIDACGVGALPDAGDYGDEGTNTLAHLAAALGGLRLPVMQALGLGSIVPLLGVPPSEDPAIYGRLRPFGPGKDSISGHWELMGVVQDRPAPTYPHGFPPDVLARLQRACGHRMICNRPDNGLAAIDEFAAEHLRTGALILYTSQDSVLQLAAHVERVPPQELYRACAVVRAQMSGEHAVGRVIARPFAGVEGAYERTDGRRDFALGPPTRSYLQELQDAGVDVHGVGKIHDLFAGLGVNVSHEGATNARALDSVEGLLEDLDRGLVFANLIETDQVYGHRRDAPGFARALGEIDARVGVMLGRLRGGDLLILTADHGVDLAHPGTDHTREYAPLLAVTGEMLARRDDVARRGHAGALGGARHDGALADVGATVLRWLTGRGAQGLPGEAFVGRSEESRGAT
jgi:phosphopentomutase